MPVVPALRMVEMSVALIAQADDPYGSDVTPVPSLVVADYETRRCAVCGCRNPPFGFGPPLSRQGTIWACGAHRDEVNRQLTATGRFTPTLASTAASDGSVATEPPRRESASPEPAVPQLTLFSY